MGASTGNMLVDDEQIWKVFSPTHPAVATHCEHTPTIKHNEETWRARLGTLFLLANMPLFVLWTPA